MNEAIKLVIIGGVAGGAACAARARRLSEKAEITIIERSPDVSYANCGMPYYIANEITDRSRLNVQTPKSFLKLLNINVETETEAIGINRKEKTITIKRLKTGEISNIPYDKLMVAPGATPIRPNVPGINDPRIHTLRSLEDMDKIADCTGSSKSVLIIGAGFIGLEMAEAFVKRGLQVKMLVYSYILPKLDPEMSHFIETELYENGVELIHQDEFIKFDSTPNTIITTLKSGATISSDFVILSIGIRPDTHFAAEAGLEVNKNGALKVDKFQRTSDPEIYAAGDAVETLDPIMGKHIVVALGGPANRQGRIAADHMFMPEKALPYPGSIGTAIIRVFTIAAGVTGWTEKQLQSEGIPYQTITVTANQHAEYYPGAAPLTLKVIWLPDNGRLIGAQAVGVDGVDKRIDVLATAISAQLTVADLCHLELSYAPPFGSARDVINIAGFAAQNVRDGLLIPIYSLPSGSDVQLIDVRQRQVAEIKPIPGATNIPLNELRQRANELDQSKPIATICALGKTSYFAARILNLLGFTAKSVSGGLRILNQTLSMPKKEPKKINKENPQVEVPPSLQLMKLDACGLACPGPIMKIREHSEQLAPGQELQIKASDPGFAADIKAYCQATELTLLDLKKEGGIYTARILKPSSEPSTKPETAAPNNPKNGATLVVFSCDLDKALATLIIANGAAALGGKVTLFFTFWGLNIIRKSSVQQVNGKSFMDKMFGWMMPRGINQLPLSRMHMGGIGTALMKWRMKNKNLPNLPSLIEEAQRAGIRMVACSMSMEAMGLKPEEFIDGIEIGGVADYLNSATKTNVNLFI